MSKDIHSMSDEEFLNASESDFVSDTNTEETTSEDIQDDQSETLNDQPDSDTTNADVVNDEQETHDKVDDGDETANTVNDTVEGVDTVDYKSFYEQVTKTFKANGKEIQVTNPDDIISLMQQGVNYSKRMAGLKPSLGIVKTLERHGLNNAEKLGYLIDLYEKKPQAIAKLVKESEVDLYEFDTSQAESYVPTKVNTEVSNLDMVFDELRDSETFNDTLSSINQWDGDSRQTVANNPMLLKIMDHYNQSGIHKKILNAIEHERMFGRLSDVSDIQAYRMMESVVLDNANVQTDKPPQGFVAPRPKQTSSDNSSKKKASNPSTGSKANTDEFNPLTMSDEELLKFMAQRQYH